MVLSGVAGNRCLGIGLGGVLGHPDFIVLFDPLRFPPVLQLAFGGVEHAGIAQLFDFLQKGQGYVCPLFLGHGLLAAVLVVKAFAVVDDGVGNGVFGNQLRHPPGFLLRLFFGDGGGEEIAPHGDAGLAALLQIIPGVAVLDNGALSRGAVAQADHGKLGAGPGQSLPIDGALVLGHVHPHKDPFHLFGLPLAAAGGEAQKHGTGQKV